MTALAATVGTGNIAGVATAIAAGGPGALFWMWMTGLVGMATKFAEAVLAVQYRVTDDRHAMAGGPMYYIERGLGWRWLGIVFAGLTAVAAFGIGNLVQANSVADALRATFGVPLAVSGAIIALATALVVLDGIQSIAKTASVIVPTMNRLLSGRRADRARDQLADAPRYRAPRIQRRVLAGRRGRRVCRGDRDARHPIRHRPRCFQQRERPGLRRDRRGRGAGPPPGRPGARVHDPDLY